jgi:hypothetical protein
VWRSFLTIVARITGPAADRVQVETLRQSGARQVFAFVKNDDFWESVDEVPEPHGFDVTVIMVHGAIRTIAAQASRSMATATAAMTTAALTATVTRWSREKSEARVRLSIGAQN